MSATYTKDAEINGDLLASTGAALALARRDLAAERARLSQALIVKEMLRAELEMRNAALDAATSHFLLIDITDLDQPIIAYVNRALARDHGYPPEELIGAKLSVLRVTEESKDARARMHAAMRAGESFRTEVQVVRKDGSWFWAGFHMSPLPAANGRVDHYVLIGADITARLEAERKKQQLQEQLYNEMKERERIAIELRLAQKLESVGRLAAGLAHEINTPIQYVGDSVYFLRSAFEDMQKLFTVTHEAAVRLAEQAGDEAARAQIAAVERAIDYQFLSEEVPKAFERTLEGADRVAGIVRAMKEFAHPDANEHSPADLNHALNTTLTVARSEYKYSAAVSTELGELPQVVCNVGELNQVFLNLIVNAAHAIQDSGRDAGSGVITIRTSKRDEETAEIVIQDNGCGISTENLEKIFDPFFTTKEVGRGTGQGLSIARSIVVDKHGGRIDVRSEFGVGTQFILTLPIAGRAAEKEAS